MEHYTPAQWVLMDMAVQYGNDMDKAVYSKRLAFGRELLEEVKTGAIERRINDAENPALFTKAVMATKDILNGKESGHLVGLDVCNSGAALQSVLLHCETGMRNTGLINTGERPDGYQKITDAMQSDVERKAVKTATVPYMYGSDYKPEQVFGSEQFPLYEAAYEHVFPMAYLCRKILVNAWDSDALFHQFELPNGLVAHLESRGLNKTKAEIEGFTFTYLHTVNRPLQAGKERGTKSLAANVIHGCDGFVVCEMDYRCNYDPNQMTKAIAAIEDALENGSEFTAPDELLNLQHLTEKFDFCSAYAVEFIKADHLLGLDKDYLKRLLALFKEIIKRPSFQLLTIHDEFKCQPNYVQYMREVYNWIMGDLYLSKWLLVVIEELTGHAAQWDAPIDMNIHAEILNNDYNLC